MRKFLAEIHKLEASKTAWPITTLAPSLGSFSYEKLYGYFGELAATALSKSLVPVHNFLTGVIGCSMVTTDQFIKRAAVPEKVNIQWPAGFSITQFGDLMFGKLKDDCQLSFSSGKIPALPACALYPWAALVDSLLTNVDQFQTVLAAVTVADKVKEGKIEVLKAISGSDRLTAVQHFLAAILKSMDSIAGAQKQAALKVSNEATARLNQEKILGVSISVKPPK